MYSILLGVFVLLSLTSLYIIKSQALYLMIIRIYVVFEYILFSYFLYNIYLNQIAKKIILYSNFPFFLFCVFDFLISSNRLRFSNRPLLFEFSCFIVFIIYFFYEKMKTVVLYPLYQSITFWICVGLFLYFSGNFFFLLFTSISTDKKLNEQMLIIYSIVTVTKNILLGLAFLANEPIQETEEHLHIPTDINLDDFTFSNQPKS